MFRLQNHEVSSVQFMPIPQQRLFHSWSDQFFKCKSKSCFPPNFTRGHTFTTTQAYFTGRM